MAWTSTKTELCAAPFLMTKLEVTADSATATAIDHGGPTLAPSFVIITSTTANPTGHEITCTAKSTTQVTFDAQAAATFEAICVWIPQARQDGQSINSDNDA